MTTDKEKKLIERKKKIGIYLLYMLGSLCVIAVTLTVFSIFFNIDSETLELIGLIGFGSGTFAVIIVFIIHGSENCEKKTA